MISDGRGTADGATLTAQVCIVGAGASGIAMALTLARRGVDVLALESGGYDFDERNEALNDGDLSGEEMEFLGTERRLNDVRRRFLGGSTNCWYGWCKPMDASDFTPRPWLGLDGWPFRRMEIEPWFDAAAGWVGIGAPDFDSDSWRRHGMPAPLVEGVNITTEVFQFSFPIRFGQEYRSALQSQSGLRVLLWSNVVDIETTQSADRVTALSVTTLEGNRFRVTADRYILSTGGIEVPRLLLASNRVESAGLGNRSDHVGRYFMEHPYMRGGLALFGVAAEQVGAYRRGEYTAPLPGGGTGTVPAAGVLKLTPAGQAEHETLNLYGVIDPVGPDELDESAAEQVTTEQATELLRLRGKTDFTLAHVAMSVEQVPQADSRVTLGSDVDEIGLPRVQVRWLHHQRERDTFEMALRFLGAELGGTDLGRVASRYQGAGPQELSYSVSSHHMGTARMSSDPAHGVVDPDCRVHGIENLFISGSAVFPTVGCSNPTFTILALALRLADHIEAGL